MKLHNLEEARQQFNDWQGNAAIFVDFEGMKAWCEVGTFHECESPVFKLVDKGSVDSPNDRYNLKVLESVSQAKYKDFEEGYEDWQINDDYRYSEIFYENK